MRNLQIIDDTLKYSSRLCFRKRTVKIDRIVIHHSWTKTIEKMVSTLEHKGCGTHYAIERDGAVHAIVKERYRTAHCAESNNRSIGIDLIRAEGQEITPYQYLSLNLLLGDIVQRHQIEKPILHKSGVFFHRDLRPTECPGNIDDSKIAFYKMRY